MLFPKAKRLSAVGTLRGRYKRGRLLNVAFLVVTVTLFKLLVDILLTNSLEDDFIYDSQESSPSWASKRLKTFSALWSHYKVRNLVVYACISTRKMLVLNWITYHLFLCPDVFYHRLFDDLFQVPVRCFSHDCLEPFGRAHYMYASFVTATYEWITSSNLEPAPPAPGCKIAVMVEPREHPLYEYTVKQVVSTLGAGWSLQLFVSKYNEEYVRRVLHVGDGKKGSNIVLTRLSDFGLDDMAYSGNRVQSAFSAHEAMYRAIKGEHILWFQIDVILRRSPPTSWLQYGYIGSEWLGCEYPSCVEETCKGVCGGGNSGLSLRRTSTLLPVATKGNLPEDLWGLPQSGAGERRRQDYFEDDDQHNNSKSRWFEDDLQLSFKLSKLHILPPGEILPRFAIGETLPKERIEQANPCGMHKPWRTPHISPQVIEILLEIPYQRAKSGLKHGYYSGFQSVVQNTTKKKTSVLQTSENDSTATSTALQEPGRKRFPGRFAPLWHG